MALDLKDYVGTWYQVGRNNAFYEIGCDTSAAVYWLEGDKMHVKNYCYQRGSPVNNGAPLLPGYFSSRSITGVARKTSNPLIFDLQFDTGDKGEYRILFTDYQNFSIIGDAATQYISILSRSPSLTSGERSLLIKVARDYGFNNFEWTL